MVAILVALGRSGVLAQEPALGPESTLASLVHGPYGAC